MDNEAGVGVHEVYKGEHVRGEEKRVKDPAFTGPTV